MRNVTKYCVFYLPVHEHIIVVHVHTHIKEVAALLCLTWENHIDLGSSLRARGYHILVTC